MCRSTSNGRRGRSALLSVLFIFCCAATLAGCGGSSDSQDSATESTQGEAATTGAQSVSSGAGKQYSVILSNGFIGNDWRPQMQKYAEAVAKLPPLVSSIKSFRVVTTQDNDPNQQAAAIQSAILEKPDILLVDASSQTALNGVIQQACNKDILVVTFDVTASAKCAYQEEPDWEAVGAEWADWLVREIGGKGTLLIDRGVPGTSSSAGMNRGVDKILAQHPDVKTYTFYSKWQPGLETSQETQLLAAHPDVDGILGYYAAQDALAKAGLKLPATGFTFPPAMKGCVDRNNPCLLAGQPPWSSAQALKDAIAIKDRTSEYTQPGFIPFPVPFFVNNAKAEPAKRSTLGEVYPLKPQFESAPTGAFLPVSPPWVEIPFDQIVG